VRGARAGWAMRDDRGYAICHTVIERGETVQLLEAICGAGAARTRAGARHLLNVPAVRAIAEDPRLQQLAAQFLGGSRTDPHPAPRASPLPKR